MTMTKPVTLDIAYINTFNTIARACIPHMDQKYAYFSDFLYDAERVARSPAGSVTYIVVRDCGTESYAGLADALTECDHYEGRVLIKVTRGKYDSDTRAERIATTSAEPSAA
jgi:hypothetical protein